MAECFQLDIAGIRFGFESPFSRLAEPAAERFYVPFSCEGPPDIRLDVRCGTLPRVKPEERLFDAVRPHRWRLARENGHYVFEMFNPRSPHARTLVARVDSSWSTVEVHTKPAGSLRGKHAWSLARLMQPLGELLVIHRLSQGQGILLHGLGVVHRGEGLVFVGHSGAGKTTLARLYDETAPEATVLNDEHIAVVKRGGTFRVYSTPWPGMHFRVAAHSAPVHRIYLLEHAKTNRVSPEHPARLCALLTQQMFLPFWNQEAIAGALRFVDELVTMIPTSRLGFVNNPEVITFLNKER